MICDYLHESSIMDAVGSSCRGLGSGHMACALHSPEVSISALPTLLPRVLITASTENSAELINFSFTGINK